MYQNSKCMYRDSMYRCVRIGKYTDINVCARTPRMHHLFPYRITYLANMKNASESVKLSSFKCFSKSSIDDPEIMHLRVASFPPAKKKNVMLWGKERFTRKIPTQPSWKRSQLPAKKKLRPARVGRNSWQTTCGCFPNLGRVWSCWMDVG